ncbi:hypothetical protein [Deinococcus multiflagellatus]|uniref:Uncharacterized protein n=1 Tax=Deinococcus multiflagellatus TaxID=1656887 RepID=A0ABW1ZPK9_9DEIO|nr:hypothetical protein [Deinococcus multiflagellatus]MBZ9714967.1 hypothetical protein [Deinococcus multiflagellatus]
MKKLLLSAALLLSTASAQLTAPAGSSPYLGANITRTYSVDDLMTRPGLLAIGKGDLYTLDFPSDVVAVVTPQSASLDIPEPIGNVLSITSKVSNGTAQMTVYLENGKYAQFMLTFTPGGTGMKRIKVLDVPKIDYAQPIPAPVPAATSMPSFTAPAPIFTPTTAKTVTGVSTDRQQVQSVLAPVAGLPAAVPAITRAQPEWLTFGAALAPEAQGDVLAVTVTNSGARPLVFNGKDVAVTVDGRQMLATSAAEIRVEPGQTQRIVLTLGGRVEPGAALTLEWLAFDAGANAFYRVATRTF